MKYGLIAIGASLGGLHAVRTVLAALPPTFPLPIAVVQHRQACDDDPLPLVLQEGCALPVREVEDKLPIRGGVVYLAPSDYHLLVDGKHFALSTEEAVRYARPSIDVLFSSAAESFGARAIGIVLTGTGADGAEGLAAIRRKGGVALIESPDTASAPEMPAAAKRAIPDVIEHRLEEIGPSLVELCRRC